MRKTLLAALSLVMACVRSTNAHQLDEYLQATRIAIEHNRIVLEMSLTPGVAVADQIFASIDGDGDDQVSAQEIEAYARTVLRDLALEFDERSYPLTLAGASSPSWSEMHAGVGTVRLEAAADVAVPPGHHRLHLVNNHRSDIGVYLVNALMPSSRDISIGAQRRDVFQHGIRLELDRATRYTSAAWILFPLLGMAVLIVCRGGGGGPAKAGHYRDIVESGVSVSRRRLATIRTALFNPVHRSANRAIDQSNQPIQLPDYQITQLPD
jgi:hypothetical protein